MNRNAETIPARHETPDLAKPGAEAGRTPLVLIESPYAGDVARNERYARACLADSLARGEAPFASHILYTQPGVLDDTDPAERHQGIQAGLAWGANATLTAVYDDLGITEGMRQGIARAEAEGRPVEVRQLAGWDAPEPARPGETVAEAVPARHETPDLAELRRLAEAATPGPWDCYRPHPAYRAYSVDQVMPEGHLGETVAVTEDVYAEVNGAFIAAANPAVVLALLDRLAHMTEARNNARAEVERLTALVEAVREYAAARQANIDHGPLLSARKAAHDALLAALARLDEEPQP